MRSQQSAVKAVPSLREKVSAVEWKTRCELAAAYRVMYYEGVHDLTHNHIVVRLPDEPDSFLIKPFEFAFDEVTASTLQKFDFNGQPRQDGIGVLKGGGIFHIAVLQARPDIGCTIHTHSTANLAVASYKHGLLPINQHGLRFMGNIAYHDYAGLEFEAHVNKKIVADLADKSVLIMRNHGCLITGSSLGVAFLAHHNFERACREQVASLSMGAENIVLIPDDVKDAALKHWGTPNSDHRPADGGKDWHAVLRKAARLFPDFDQ